MCSPTGLPSAPPICVIGSATDRQKKANHILTFLGCGVAFTPALVELLDCEGIAWEIYERHRFREFVRGDVRLKAVPTWLADDMKCCGYEISAGTQTIYFSGDSYEIDLQILQKFLQDCISILYQETTSRVTEYRSRFPLPELGFRSAVEYV